MTLRQWAEGDPFTQWRSVISQQNEILVKTAERTSTLAHGKEPFGSREEKNFLTS
jgi:hypothetical protein